MDRCRLALQLQKGETNDINTYHGTCLLDTKLYTTMADMRAGSIDHNIIFVKACQPIRAHLEFQMLNRPLLTKKT